MSQQENPSATEQLSFIAQGQTYAPIVDKTWKKRLSLRDAKQSFSWAFVNLCMVVIMYLEMCYGAIGHYFSITHPLLWYIEFTLCFIFMMNIGFDLFRYLTNGWFGRQVEVTLEQKHLLGIKDNDPGFQLSPTKSPVPSESSGSLVFTNTPSSQLAYTPSSSPWGSLGHVTPTNLPGSFLTTPQNYTSPGMSFLSNSSLGHTSFDRLQNSSLSQGNMSYVGHQSFSPSMAYSPGASISSLDSSGIRSRLSMSSSFRSPSPSDKMTDLQSLSLYLRDQEEKDYRAALSSPDLSFGSPSFWNHGRHLLKKNQYQMASRSPQSHKSRADDTDNMGEEVWRPLGVTDDDLFLWIEKLRKWMGNTIMMALHKEIDSMNTSLRKLGCEDTEIGEVGVSTIKQLALTKGQYVPTLNALVPYLDFSSNQEYLVKRIKELGSDGCVSEYSWASGGTYGKTWGEHLPTDAALVMHMFCTYMDSRLPPEIRYPDGKTFTCQHFLKTPDKPDLEKSDNLLIYQSSINPPHFQVVIKNTFYNLPKGRNNLFHAILLFLYHVKTKENGMLGRINLGMSGVNILSVLDK